MKAIKEHNTKMMPKTPISAVLGVNISNIESLLSGQSLALLVALPCMFEIVTL